MLTLADPAYPPPLLHSADPPLMLYVQGDLALLQAPSIAIVGSRQCTAQGRDNAQRFATVLAEAGWCVVSGLALGIDAAAHRGALLAAGGRTLAVLGTGPDRLYPSQHAELARQIAERGALVSEYAPGTPALRENFPQRNRIIAGVTRGTLVVEAALKSGSLITARLASEAGREVYALPGSIHAEQSRGCHALIRQGALLVETPQDILDDLGATSATLAAAPAAATTPAPAQPSNDPLLSALGTDPLSLDELGARTGWGSAELAARLLELELDGQVARLPGGLYQRRYAG